MDHDEALRLTAVEKYLLGELEPPARDEFEAHYFDCAACAEDLRASAAFLDLATAELRGGLAVRPPASAPARSSSPSRTKSWFTWLWRPEVSSSAFALSLLVIVYQNVVVAPRATADGAAAAALEVLPEVSLAHSNGRTAGLPNVAVANRQSFLLDVEIPPSDGKFTSYVCVLLTPAGTVALRSRPIFAEETHDTIHLAVPAAVWPRGEYTLVVEGRANDSTAEPVEVARNRFTMAPIN